MRPLPAPRSATRNRLRTALVWTALVVLAPAGSSCSGSAPSTLGGDAAASNSDGATNTGDGAATIRDGAATVNDGSIKVNDGGTATVNDASATVSDASVSDAAMTLADAAPDLSPHGSCGTRGAGTCASDELCEYPVGTCGATDVGGSCVQKPANCADGGTPACGCDQNTYANDCLRAAAAVSLDHLGRCDYTCDHDSDCTDGQLCCYPCGIPNCPNKCTSPLNGKCPMFP